ncbi:N-acetylglucosamine kinase [Aeromonas caviae]|uniref:BadF/BadG/BcrA/BcrD ATPase family protein n=1 Tax=Aeromonas caviae TaxID=648 RepID=UPI002DB79321|nr:BadF/BadG/BcrA/BcrD ATPase family protein [Aeromonas caviae]MEB6639899.1 N-acetylglucosamine kinase [Aeromonas caviae]
MIEFWVGVDGGGTHTRARIRNNAGKLLGEGRAAGSNLELGIALAHGHVLAAIDQARIDAGLPRESEQRMGVGLALASAELADCYHAMLTMPFPFARVKLTSDAFGACLGAFDGQEGAILIAGTGSDLGSGAWLGLRAIQQSLLCHDGILPPSTLAVRLMDHFKRDQAEVVRWAARAIPADYGRFAPWVFDAASDGDDLATALLDETCAQLGMLLEGMTQLGADRIALLGGIGTRLAPRLGHFHLVAPKRDALEGAILFARTEALPCLHP